MSVFPPHPVRAALFWLIWAWLAIAAGGAESPYLIDVWTPYQGLPQSQVLSIAQTPDGYLWVGTRRGWLARFDGVRFTNYTRENTPAFRTPEIQMLAVDRRGALWIGDLDGRLLRLENGKFRVVVEKDKPDSPHRVMEMLDGPDDAGFVTSSAALLRLDPRPVYENDHSLPRPPTAIARFGRTGDGQIWGITGEGAFGVWTHEKHLPASLGGARATDLAPAPDNGLWIATSAGLWQRGADGFQRATVDLPAADRALWQVAAAPDGGVWLRSDDAVLLVRQGKVVCRAPMPDLDAEPLYQPLEMHADSRGGLWIVKYGAGVWHVDPAGAVVVLNSRNGLPSDLVETWFEDREKNVWLGTAAGLVRLRPRWFRSVGGKSLGAGSGVSSICEDSAGTIWLGRDNGLDRLRSGALEEIHIPIESGRFPISSVTVSPGAEPGELWIGTVQNGVHRLRDGVFDHPFPFDAAGLAIRTIRTDPLGGTWFGSEFGLFRWDGANLRGFGPADGLTPGHIFDLSFAANGDAWIAKADENLVRYRNGRFEPVPLPGMPPNVRILSLVSDPAGNVWLGTVGAGLFHFFGGKLSHCTTGDGLPGDSVSQLIFDDNGHLWGGTQRGIFRMTLPQPGAAPVFRTYDDADGLPAAECSGGLQPACWKSRDGHLWFSTTASAIEIDPAKVEKSEIAPPVVIEEMLVGGEPRQISEGRISLSPGPNRCEFRFTAPSFLTPRKVSFRWRLTGVDDGWVEGGAQRTATYSGLAPRDYVFSVIASNDDGVWSAAPATVAFRVLPGFWQRGPVQAAAFLSGIALVGLAIFFWGRRIHARELQRLEYEQGLERQRFRHKQAMDAERARIAAELHDDLGANLTQIQWLGDGAPTADDSSGLRARIVRMSRKSRDTVRLIDEIVWAVNPKNDNLAQLATYVCNFAEQYFRDSPTRARIDIDGEIPPVPLAADVRHNLFLIAKEALHNVARHSGADRVWLRLALRGQRFELIVEDHGRGFDPATAGAGDGLANMRRRAAIAGVALAIESSPGTGTRVILALEIPSAAS